MCIVSANYLHCVKELISGFYLLFPCKQKMKRNERVQNLDADVLNVFFFLAQQNVFKL